MLPDDRADTPADSPAESPADAPLTGDDLLATVGHGPAHHHRPTGIVARITDGLVGGSIRNPKRVMWLVALLTAVVSVGFVRVQVDTDPENMLPADAPVRLLNQEIRDTFGGREMIVVGLFGDESLVTADALDAAASFHDQLTTVDGVAEDAMISVRTAIETPPADDAAAAALADAIAADPLLGGNVLSADGDTLAFFVALDSKSDALPVQGAANEFLDASPALSGLERHIAGLPLAQEAFGEQMFIQMGVFAPLAGLAIFALMMVFFRRLVLVGPAMLLAMLTVIWAMGLLVGTGNTLHIMSSMIPIFLMPIAILDAIHVISEFFDRYGRLRDRATALQTVYDELAGPITFTTITTVVGFGALAITPIPPVRVFGIFVAIGVAVAWLATLTVLPAVLMLVKNDSIDRAVGTEASGDSRFAGVVRSLPLGAMRHRFVVLGGVVALAAIAVPMVARIEVNDNPVKWFSADHEVRIATGRLNDELPGTFGANLILSADDPALLQSDETVAAVSGLQAAWDASPIVGTSASYVDLTGGATGDAGFAALDAAREASSLTVSLITYSGDQANLRLQLRDGDNQAMRAVLDLTDEQLAAMPLPAGVTAEWGGETYLNLVWQDEMVHGMFIGFLITLGIVFLLLALLFRSIWWGIVGIVPVLWTILIVYGAIGLIGKDYDMPIAVLSTLVLGIGVDFAIHFVERFRELLSDLGDARSAIEAFAEEPARALSRNAAVIAIGFLPLLFSSLTPYVIVGLFLAAIIMLSWLTTVVALPAAVIGFRNRSND